MNHITLGQVLTMYGRVMAETGGAVGIRSLDALESAVAQPRMAFGGRDLYPSVVDKAAALGFSLIANHPFIDGNKRVGHAAMEVLLVLNGLEIRAPEPEQEHIILRVASGEMDREGLTNWLRAHTTPTTEDGEGM